MLAGGVSPSFPWGASLRDASRGRSDPTGGPFDRRMARILGRSGSAGCLEVASGVFLAPSGRYPMEREAAYPGWSLVPQFWFQRLPSPWRGTGALRGLSVFLRIRTPPAGRAPFRFPGRCRGSGGFGSALHSGERTTSQGERGGALCVRRRGMGRWVFEAPLEPEEPMNHDLGALRLPLVLVKDLLSGITSWGAALTRFGLRGKE